jgi:hypothetical protein
VLATTWEHTGVDSGSYNLTREHEGVRFEQPEW